MAIKQYEMPNGEIRWEVYVNLRSKTKANLRVQKRTTALETMKEAEREELRLLRSCERELVQLENRGEVWGSMVDKFETYIRRDIDSGLAETSKLDYVAAIQKHTLAWWNREVAELTKTDVKELFMQLKADGYSLSHMKRMRTVINRVFDFGIENRLLSGTLQAPTVGINLGREQETKPEILNISEIRRLLEAAKKLQDPWYPIWAMALLTGMRNGELYALVWDDVDLVANTISVNKSYNKRLNVIKSTKSGYCRTVPISSELKVMLLELKKESEKLKRKFVLPRSWKWDDGRQAVELRRFCLGLGLPSIRFHALRACFATQLIRSGVPPIQIQKICGWKDLKTMQRYIRLAGIEIDGVTEVLKVLPSVEVFEKLGRNIGQPRNKP
ncbi:MAG: site-specific integrase [Bdellovibrionota bacterium]